MFRRYGWTIFLCAIVMLCAGADTQAARRAKKKLLIVTHTAGFRHDSIPTAETTLAEIGARSGVFTVDYCRNADDVKKMLTPAYLKSYDGVFFANTTGNLGIPDLKAFLEWVKSGKAFLGAHSATDTYKRGDVSGDASFVEMIGAEFAGHGKQCEVEPNVEAPKHPAVAHLAPRFKMFDEIYHFKENPRGKSRILAALDKHPDDGMATANQPGDHPLIWCHRYGKGRVFYTAFGHRKEIWEDERFRQQLLGAIRWAFGMTKSEL